MGGLRTALSFLTIAPVGVSSAEPRGAFGRAASWFPLVGLLVGLALAGVDWCGRAVWDPAVAAALVVGAGLLLTGGLHLDGLMDTADALFSRAGRDRMLEIMRDPRSGALGVAAGASLLLLKFAAYGHLAGSHHWRVIAAAPAMGRLAIVVALGAFPYAREAGTGRAFADEVKGRHAAAALVLGAAIAVLLLGWMGLTVFALALATAVAMGLYVQRRLGGLTGDIYGAINEFAEVGALLLGAVVLQGIGG